MTTWSDTEDVIIGGDLAVALGYLTPAGGVVVTPVAPTGLRDRAAGTVSFSTSLGFGRKLERIARNPRVALAFHAREHGFANDPHFVLVQGEATYETEPQPETVERILAASERYFGSGTSGFGPTTESGCWSRSTWNALPRGRSPAAQAPRSVARYDELGNDHCHENLAICGDYSEPSVGLEPTTPSLPWKVQGFTSVH
jgi:hypothetical protein